MNKLNYWAPNWLAIDLNNKVVRDLLPELWGRVIDLGCGSAPYKPDIQKVAAEYIGVDWPNSAHDQASVDIAANLSAAFPIRDECADVAVSFQVLEHIPEPQYFVSECHRILKPGGKIILTTPFMWHVHEAPHDYFRYTRYGLTYLLEQAGFTQVDIREVTGFWQMFVLKFNYYTRRFASGPLRYIWIPIWFLGQVLAPLLDRLDKCPGETAGYRAIARKPDVS